MRMQLDDYHVMHFCLVKGAQVFYLSLYSLFLAFEVLLYELLWSVYLLSALNILPKKR